MTQVAELPLPSAPRAAETRFVYSVCFAHFVSHYYMLLLAPLFIFIKDDFGVSYTELGLALTLFNIVSTVGQTPVGFLVDRWNARYMLVAGLLVGAGALAVAGLVNSFWVFLAMFAVRASATPSTTRPTTRCSDGTFRSSAPDACSPTTPSPACSAMQPRRRRWSISTPSWAGAARSCAPPRSASWPRSSCS